MNRKLYQVLANKVQAMANCHKSGNEEWLAKHGEMAEALVREFLPSGSGFDNGTSIYLGNSTGEKLVFATSFHHMDEFGSYDGWSDHTVTVRPSMIHDIVLTISGRDRNDIKDYIHEAFHSALTAELSRDDEIAIATRLGHMAAA